MKTSVKYILLSALFALALFTGGTVKAQSIDFAQLVVTEDVAPEDRLAKKIELTATALGKANERVLEMKAKLETIAFDEGTPELELRSKLIERANEYGAFYVSESEKLATLQTLEGVDALINEIIAYREQTYAPGAREILEFNLVYSYTPSVLKIADERLGKILGDVSRLEGLDLIEPDSFTARTDEAKNILQRAHDLQTQAAALLMENYAISLLPPPEEIAELAPAAPEATVTVPVATPRTLAEGSLNEVKKLYELFIQTGQQVGESLGIN